MEKNQDLRSYFEPRIKELTKLSAEIAEKDTKGEYDYMVSDLAKLMRMMNDCEQYITRIDPDGEPILVDRVIRVNRYIKGYLLDMHGIDHTVVGGLFIEAPIYLLPKNKVEKALVGKKVKSILDPESCGLPSFSEADYGTIKLLSGSCYMALAKFPGNYVNEIVSSIRHYDYVEINK